MIQILDTKTLNSLNAFDLCIILLYNLVQYLKIHNQKLLSPFEKNCSLCQFDQCLRELTIHVSLQFHRTAVSFYENRHITLNGNLTLDCKCNIEKGCYLI